MVSPIFEFLYKFFGINVPDDGGGSAPPPLQSIPNEPTSNFYALVIGINKYHRSEIRQLRGAVPDAQEVVRYLRARLRVPEKQITTLYDLAATRSEIIKAFESLATNPNIKKQDPILIYYAGHGGQLAPPPGWPTGNQKIQSLVPSDEGIIAQSGNKVESIPDYTLAALLNSLAKEKGDNVTVIFDSCHSSSGTRDDAIVRHVDSNVLTPLRLDTDRDILSPGTRTFEIPKDQTLIGSRSHVLIAACGAEETAKETPGARGVFTEALVEVLDEVNADVVTYVGLLDRLRALPNQKPQCEGENRRRVLFDAKAAGADRQFVRVLKDGSQYSLQAGAVQGIKVGAHFDVHGDRFLDSNQNPSLGSFVVKSVGPRQSTLAPLDSNAGNLPDLIYARQTLDGRSHQLLVFFTQPFVQKMDDDINGWKSGLGMSDHGAVEFGYARTESEAGLIVGREGLNAVFDICNPLVKENGLTRIPHTTPLTPQDVLPVIRAAAKWNWHVNRTNPNDPFKGQVRIEMTRLERPGGGLPTPVGDNLNDGSFGVVDLVVPGNVYGFKLVNESKYDLYPYLFYFDANDQSITPLFEGAHGGVAGADPQLTGKGPHGTKVRGEFTLGYGPGGVVPLTMNLAGSQDHGVVVLKLFVTTKPADFDMIQQFSPFGPSRVPDPAPGYNIAGDVDLWGTTMMIVAQRTTPKPKPALQPQVDMNKALQEHLIARSPAPAMIHSTGYNQTEFFWFQTPPISANRLAIIHNMRLRTYARDQAKHGPISGNSWFDIRVLDAKGETKTKKSDGKRCIWTSHTNEIDSKDYVWLDGPVFGEYHEIWKNVEPENALQVVLNAQMKDCVNDALEGHLMFW